MLKFTEDRWIGNQWASIEIEPVDDRYFLSLLFYLTRTYQFPQPNIIDAIDGYIADFKIQDCKATIRIDTWTFSIAFEQDAVRDAVLEALCGLPEDYFEL